MSAPTPDAAGPELTELDRELLEVLTLEIPWYMVCGEFHTRYGGAEALIARLLQLQRAGLLRLRNIDSPQAAITAEMLLDDARRNDCYQDIEDTREPHWDLVATDRGFALVAHRLGRE